jgi:4-carboxymuconolactone decarboxylase
MSRIPLLKPEAMDSEQKRVYDDVLAKTGRASGGPSIAYAYVPGLWEANNSVSAYLENKSALTKTQIRIAALVTVRKWNSDFPWAAQARMALDSGLDPKVVDAINSLQRPVFANAEDEAVYNVAREVVDTGTLTQASFDAAMKVLGNRRLIEVVGAVGQFCKTAMVANLAGATAPADAPSKLK